MVDVGLVCPLGEAGGDVDPIDVGWLVCEFDLEVASW